MTNFKAIPGSIVAPRGFMASGVFCGVKQMGTGKGSEKGQKRDLALIYSTAPAVVAGMFTTNQVRAAPVKITQGRVTRGTARAVVINSGNANACTGASGLRNALRMTSEVARNLRIVSDLVLVASTGRIGLPLPMPRIKDGIAEACRGLSDRPAAAGQAAEAIMTSDTHRKQIAVEFEMSGKTVRLGAIAKGAGMIQPGMSSDGSRPASTPAQATMLCFLTTDAAVSHPVLGRLLARAVAQSFNRITVDGDMSTNDTVLLLANGLAGNPVLEDRRRRGQDAFQAALERVTLELAKMLVSDGEGVSRVITVQVKGAVSFQEADAAARAVANSSLVKTSWCGGDPNWGRLMDALGYSPAKVIEEKVDIAYSFSGQRRLRFALKQGRPTRTSLAALREITTQPAFDLHLNLNLGGGAATIYAGDLTEAYVDFNKGE